MPVLRFIEPCLPSPADRPPSGTNWIHEIKHDGYRLMARRDSVGIRLITGRGNDWSDRFPLVIEAVNHLKARYCALCKTMTGPKLMWGCDQRGAQRCPARFRLPPWNADFAPLSARKWRKTRGDRMFETRSLRLSVCGIDWPSKPRCRNLCSPAS